MNSYPSGGLIEGVKVIRFISVEKLYPHKFLLLSEGST
jgi:hypothetical protein